MQNNEQPIAINMASKQSLSTSGIAAMASQVASWGGRAQMDPTEHSSDSYIAETILIAMAVRSLLILPTLTLPTSVLLCLVMMTRCQKSTASFIETFVP